MTQPFKETQAIATLIKENDRTYRDRSLRVIGDDGEQLGIMSFADAIAGAQRKGYDLVLVSDKSDPVVVRYMDYGKLVFEQKKKEKDQKRKSSAQKVKEVKFGLRINENDYRYKMNHALEFLGEGHKLKLTIQFSGRELAHKEIGFDLYNRIAEELLPHANPENEPKLLGRSISVNFQPKSNKHAPKPKVKDDAGDVEDEGGEE